jgi:long-chain acyl-CoA synthetase
MDTYGKPWLKQYPAGVAMDIDASAVPSLVALMEAAFVRHVHRPAFRFMGRAMSYAALDAWSRDLAAWFCARGLVPGDRIAVMLPNVPQYPVTVAAALRAGLVVVNVNPMYTPRELEHQLRDSGARAVVILENFAATLQVVLDRVPIPHVVVAATGDLLGWVQGRMVNHVVRRVRKLVPHWELPAAVPFRMALAAGRDLPLRVDEPGPDAIAVLQYTGGTTGVSKAAVLLHRHLVANVLQCEAWNGPAMSRLEQMSPGEQPVVVCALPLHHIFAFTCNLLLGMRMGACNILIPNARDIGALLKELSRQRFHSFPAVNTLFNAIVHHPDVDGVDWSGLLLSVGGGMAVQQTTARLWLEKTGCTICEGYGLSETSPSVTCNPTDTKAYGGTIGLPLPGTDVRLLDEDGQPAAPGQPGEIAVRGPQVMAGYWQRPDETAKVMTADGYLRTGDIGTMDERGYFRVVDRKKDMILVSGFNVYPAEIEEVITQMPGVLECAAVGMPDAKAGEVVKAVVVKKEPSVTEGQIRAWCEANLTGYKRPRVIEFRAELPKTAVGKVLRRELRG